MREGTAALVDALSGSFTVETVCDVFRGTDRVLQDQRFTGWSLSGDMNSAVKYSGSGTLVIPSVAGESAVPNGTSGTLSPFGAVLTISVVVSAGRFSERVLLGWFKVTAVTDAADSVADVNGISTVIASSVTVEFRSLDERIKRAGFRSPEQPSSETTCWAELRRIGILPVKESLPDVVVPSGLTWTAEKGKRLEAAETLAAALGGVLIPTSDARITVAPNVGDVVMTLELGEYGTVLDVGHSVESDDVPNEVIGVYEAADGTPIYARAVATGALGEDDVHTAYHSSPEVTDQASADLAVERELARAIRAQYVDRRVVCVMNPLVEIGDFVEVVGWDRPLSGQVRQTDISDEATMTVTIREVLSL
ncbi:hypothetical protein [Microbacterium sp. AG1240]|uniref:hypothetical protein n=1 Tax=Microbacterium sp. AG1240 TaxID=2183992 RepID=UPI0011C41632|nr:hypothetical protein [Microbacterium sp. AG1240]